MPTNIFNTPLLKPCMARLVSPQPRPMPSAIGAFLDGADTEGIRSGYGADTERVGL